MRAAQASISGKRSHRHPSQLKETIRNLTAEKDVLQRELGVAIAERSKVQLELGAMKREAESTWAAERVENALLRERINDVAAEVVKLAVTLEGPNSPIEAILAAETVPVRKSVNSNRSGNDERGCETQSCRPHARAAKSRLPPRAAIITICLFSFPAIGLNRPAHQRAAKYLECQG